MKSASLLLIGAGIALGASGLVSALRPPQGGMGIPQALDKGSTIFGLNVLGGLGQDLNNLEDTSAVTIRDVSGRWLLIDSPSLKTGSTWINTGSIISFRTDH